MGFILANPTLWFGESLFVRMKYISRSSESYNFGNCNMSWGDAALKEVSRGQGGTKEENQKEGMESVNNLRIWGNQDGNITAPES